MRFVICGMTERDLECTLANLLGPPAVPGFGCSDCRCYSHLFFRQKDPRSEIVNAIKRLDIDPSIKTIKNPGR
jgi:Uri superfamily endonuclease